MTEAIVTHRNGDMDPAKTDTRAGPRLPLSEETSIANRGLLRVDEAAAWLGLGRTKTYELVARGKLPSVSIGRCRRVPLSALRSFVDRLVEDAV